MSEEELELDDLLTHTLEMNGCLSKIKAELRANLFLTLNEDSNLKQQPQLNSKIKSCLDHPEGELLFSLVYEFLEYFNLDFTASVYEPESNLGLYYKYEGRQKVGESLGLQSVEGPLILHLIKIAQMKAKTLNINLTNISGERVNGYSSEAESSVHNEEKESGENVQGKLNLNYTYVKPEENDDTFNGTSSIEEESANGVESEEQNTSSESKSEDKTKASLKSDKLKTKVEINKTRGGDLLPSLYNKDFKEKSKDYDFEIKDDYEEDFSDLNYSQSKVISPKPSPEELQQCSDNATNVSDNTTNKSPKSNSTENIETNISTDEDVSDNYSKSHFKKDLV